MNLLPRPLAYGIMVLVSLVWLVNFAAQFFVAGYQSDPLIHGIFTGIVGGALALARKGDPPSSPPAPTPTPTPTPNEGAK